MDEERLEAAARTLERVGRDRTVGCVLG